MLYSLKRISKWYTCHNDSASSNIIKKKYYLHFPDLTTQYINIRVNDLYEYQIKIGTNYINNGLVEEHFDIFGMDHASCVFLVDQNRKEVEWQIKKFIM